MDLSSVKLRKGLSYNKLTSFALKYPLLYLFSTVICLPMFAKFLFFWKSSQA